MTGKTKFVLGALLAALPLWQGVSRGEEVWLHDNTRIYGLVQSVSPDKTMTVQLPTGDERKVPLEDIVAIRFLGRNPLLVQSGTQEVRFVNGGAIRGQIFVPEKAKGGISAAAALGTNIIALDTAMAGRVAVDMARIKGFLALPLVGFGGRKAEELVESETDWAAGQVFPMMRDPKTTVILPEAVLMSRPLDVVLNNRGSVYPGVVRRLEQTDVILDHENMFKEVPLKILSVAGIRLADATRDAVNVWQGDVQVRLWGRDDSRVQGHVNEIRLGRWQVLPFWDVKSPLSVDLEEISAVQVLGGRVQYLSQLTPVSVKESTVLAPPQPYRMDRSCQGDPISIVGKRYPWGIGVHANSELTFALNGKFHEFRSDIGIATRMGDRGSVVFRVLGDGKELYKSPVIRGAGAQAAASQPDGQSQAKLTAVNVDVTAVKLLTLEVTDAGDLDLGDVANWGSARVLR